jgi:hypothetical protein
MPFSFISVAADAPGLRVGEIRDGEFDELAECVFCIVRNYEGPVDKSRLWPHTVDYQLRTQTEFKMAAETTRGRLIIAMELDPLHALLEMLFPKDEFTIVETSSPDTHFSPQTQTDWTLFSVLKKRFVACVEIKTHSIKKFVDILENGPMDADKSYYTKFCQQLLSYFIQYETNRLVLTDGRWYVFLEISGDPQSQQTSVEIPIRYKAVDSFDPASGLTPIVLFLYCSIKSRNPSDNELQRIKNARHLVLYNKNKRDHGVSASPLFVAILKKARSSLLNLNEQQCPAFIDEACRYLDSKSGWLFLRFDYNYSEPLKVTILQEREYNTKVLQIGRDLFPDFFERMEAIPPESNRVILKVYDEFEMMNPSSDLAFGFYSAEQFIAYQLKDHYFPELVALKSIEYHNRTSTGIKVNSARLFDCGQLEMVLDDSKNYVWRILTRGCFLLQEYVEDHGDSALTQARVTTGLQQLEQLSKIGIWHQDIKRSNLRIQSDSTVCFIDYSNVKLYDPKCEEESLRSYESMKESFLSVMKEIGVVDDA